MMLLQKTVLKESRETEELTMILVVKQLRGQIYKKRMVPM